MTAPGARRHWHADLALAGVALIWGATFVVVKDALREVSTLLFLALRFTVATCALALVFRRRAVPFQQWSLSVWAGLAAGACLFAGYTLQTAGLRYTTPSKSAFLTSLSIVLVPFLASLVGRRRPDLYEVAGAITATAGVGLMTLPGGRFDVNPGDTLTLLCALAFAAHILVVGYFSGKVVYENLAVMQIAIAALLGLGTFWWAEPPMIRWSVSVAGAVAITGLMATALAFSVQVWAQQYTTPVRTALVFSLEPVFAWLTSFLVAGERLSRGAVLGAALILSGILLVELKPGRRGARR
jgi:drug/metabolite transporter (DMT)-like permease